MMLIKTQLFYIRVRPMVRQARYTVSTEQGNAPQMSSFPHIFSCVTLLNQHAINGPVTGGTWSYLISADDCILKHLRTLLRLSWTHHQNNMLIVCQICLSQKLQGEGSFTSHSSQAKFLLLSVQFSENIFWNAVI